MTISRRAFASRLLIAFPFVAGVAGLAAQDRATPPAPDGAGAADRLRDPTLVGRPRDSVSAFDNDPTVIGIERRLKCTCGCTLDIYTCRTTDFTCTFSPALHGEVVAMVRAGQTPEQIVAAFVEREGQAILMAPPAQGFNLAGYLVPGLSVTAVGLALVGYLSRRRAAVTAASDESAPSPDPAMSLAPDAEQLDRLRRALDDVES